MELGIKPVFIFSLPRSGSTLLQRMLAGHPDIETTSEMWFLLPLVYSLRDKGIYTQYNTKSLNKALTYILSQLPNGEKDYFNAIKLFANTIYSKLSKKNAIYFLDKTPRYYLIINEIRRIFPEAKCLFLFRHPLSVIASVIESFNRGKMGDINHKIDMYKGPLMLASGYSEYKDNCYAIQYESLITQPEETIKNICSYLQIQYSDTLTTEFSNIPLKGLGDKFSSKAFNKINTERVNRWKTVLGTRYRKRYAKKYINYLGEHTIKTFGYDFNEIISEIEQLETKNYGGIKDFYHETICNVKSFIDWPMLKKRIQENKENKDKFYINY